MSENSAIFTETEKGITVVAWDERPGERCHYLRRRSAQRQDAMHGADILAEQLRGQGPEGLRVIELSAGETGYDQMLDLYQAQVEAVCEVYLYAVADEGGAFLNFEIRGERIE